MDRRLILAVAGSGKTTYILNRLDTEKRFLIVTYTENNLSHIRETIIKRFGYEPNNITIKSYFQFLIQDCYRPFLKDIVQDNGIFWRMPSEVTFRYKRDNPLFYLTREHLLYHNRIAKLCQEWKCVPQIKARIEKFYDCFLFDEIQDLGGHDFNLMLDILPSIDCVFVGDFFQHTFDTSQDGAVNKSLYNNYETYKRHWKLTGVVVDETTLSNSYRCSPTICDYVREQLKIAIYSYRSDNTQIQWIDNQEKADELYNDDNNVKLFYNRSYQYRCFAENWGKSKGLDHFEDVCIVVNTTTLRALKEGNASTLKPSTKNKLYVACTRAKRDIYFIPDSFYKKYKE